ncbi:2-oxo-4-hydroxy-4-carboxy-5-ureidoimidazoline decarboxylase [Microbacterium laevaniformans]|uniref:2-oxo-4-hydroxy-4-carboxy-5-ureidoimidazoline decarboxylase n=2 Tax=Microbacterium laevaniformans TaxID=36807 RepID=A0A4S2CZ34_9MICO|nr:2-oxo-4-hydroxy-4-carboxy-5-ureidoimidazoline decarboxylase [Microbacterium laevaniformans]
MVAEMSIDAFDALPADAAASTVGVWAAVPAWVDAVVAGRPYGTRDALIARADALARTWTRTELDAALAHHPRIGEKPRGAGADAEASRREQASMSSAAAATATAIADGNAAYEQRFGRVFLIRAAGRTPEQMRDELERRLGNDDETEAAEALDQLREIALLRLEATIA